MELQKIFRRITSSGNYLPEIDGFRFIAIMWVVLFHSLHPIIDNTHYILKDSIKDYSILNTFFANGFQGVELFFVISGFILGMPFAKQNILKEKKVRLKSYYLRRVTRLEPPYIIAMCFFFIVLIIKGDYKFFELLPSLGASLIYLHNIIFKTYPYITMVAWSLEIEVQFYLLAPFLSLIFLLPMITRRTILISLIAIFPVVQWFLPLHIMTLYSFIEFFLAGFLLTDLYLTSNKIKLSYILASILGLILLIFILFTNLELNLLNGVIYPFLILAFYYISLNNSIWNKIFKIKVIALIGGMCYSIYLLHFPLISLITTFSHIYKVSDYIIPNLIVNSVVVIVLTLIVSSVYYLLIERPFMDKNFPKRLYSNFKKLIGIKNTNE